MSRLRRLVRRFLPRRKHPILDAAITPAARDDEYRARYASLVASSRDPFVVQRYEEGCRWRQVILECGGKAAAFFPPTKAAALPPHSKVLDVGGGNGAIELAFAANAAAFVVSVDALWNDDARALGVRRVLADAAALPFRPGVFDTLLCLETIEHVTAPRAVAAEIARVAAAGALVLVTTPPKWRYAVMPDPHFGIRALTLWPPSLQRRIAARRGFTGPQHFVDRIYRSVDQLQRVFAPLTLVDVLARDRWPKGWFWDALLFRKPR